ncbi:hypothetical protein A6V25_13490 [Nostoc sp. ATCC 53789]|nr:hypothetical protein A6V25_13490 [Nostoc sp. ATCC 53789]
MLRSLTYPLTLNILSIQRSFASFWICRELKRTNPVNFIGDIHAIEYCTLQVLQLDLVQILAKTLINLINNELYQ